MENIIHVPNETPVDAMEAAYVAHGYEIGSTQPAWVSKMTEITARAIMAERERCARIAETAVPAPEGGEWWMAMTIADGIRGVQRGLNENIGADLRRVSVGSNHVEEL